MQEDRPNIEDDLDLDETESAGVRAVARADEAAGVDDPTPAEQPLSVDGDELESFGAAEPGQEATDEVSPSPAGGVDCAEQRQQDARVPTTAHESEPGRRFDLHRIHNGLKQWIHRQGARVSSIVPHPLVAVGVVMLVGGGIHEISGTDEERAQPTPPARVVSDGFEAPDFRRADKGSITERQAAAALAQHRTEQSAPHATGRQYATSGARASGTASNVDVATSTDGLFTAEQMQEAVAEARKQALQQVAGRRPQGPRHGLGRRRATRAHGSVSTPPVAATDTAEERRSLPAYLVGFSDDAAKEAPEAPKIDLPVGTRIPAVLDLGISSARHGTAVARTTTAVVDASGRKIPAGSVLTGRSSSSQDRVYVDFTAIRVGAETFQLRAVGTENEDMGLLAERIEAPMSERTASRLADGALGAVRGLAAAGGGMVGRAVSQATGGVINEAQREQRVDRSVTLKVAAGTSFVVVVTG